MRRPPDPVPLSSLCLLDAVQRLDRLSQLLRRRGNVPFLRIRNLAKIGVFDAYARDRYSLSRTLENGLAIRPNLGETGSAHPIADIWKCEWKSGGEGGIRTPDTRFSGCN